MAKQIISILPAPQQRQCQYVIFVQFDKRRVRRVFTREIRHGHTFKEIFNSVFKQILKPSYASIEIVNR